AFKGRSISALPDDLLAEIAKLGGGSLAFGVRQGKEESVTRALEVVRDRKAPLADRTELIDILGEARQARSVPMLVPLLADTENQAVRKAALIALQAYDDEKIGSEGVRLRPKV